MDLNHTIAGLYKDQPNLQPLWVVPATRPPEVFDLCAADGSTVSWTCSSSGALVGDPVLTIADAADAPCPDLGTVAVAEPLVQEWRLALEDADVELVGCDALQTAERACIRSRTWSWLCNPQKFDASSCPECVQLRNMTLHKLFRGWLSASSLDE